MPSSRYATRFCAAGAIMKAIDGRVITIFFPRFWRVAVSLSKAAGIAIPTFNDTHTHSEVLAAFDKAIEAERAKVQP